MNTIKNTPSSSIYSCNQHLLITCIISCFICTIVMIWGVYVMRADMGPVKSQKNISAMNHSNMDMSDPMSMSMRDMGIMLEGKSGDALDKAFLEGMIPHHQGAIDMARYLANSDKPELVKLGAEIIVAQQKEIDQMKQWMIDWGYAESSKGPLDPEEEMMREHCKEMPNMVGCEQYK